ncbi:MAG: putative quercetin 2,3-dioxygenase [Alphaproteobacteria bacterium]|nr:MAG: putative quercetin 2,3-dioxygenase [Alphaproteobacteria bacterium]
MIEVRPFETLGRFENDWLSARYHFSFAEYRDPARMGFGPLRVWNDDMIQPQRGFDYHGHRDMEIITYIRRGAITHGDHLGNRGRTEAGDVQVMSAGKGIMHAEFNMEQEPTTLFQIWIEPAARAVAPRWAQRRFPVSDRAGRFSVLASGRASDGADALPIHQDAALLGVTLRRGQSATHAIGAARRAYLVPATGRITVNGVAAKARDGIAVTAEEQIVIQAEDDSEIVLVDLP